MSDYTEDLGLEKLTDGQEDAGDALNVNADELDKGYTRKLVLGETGSEGQVFYYNSATGKCSKGDNTAEASSRVGRIGLLTADGVLDDERRFRYFGRFELADWTSVTGSALLTDGAIYYLGTSGQLTATKPTGASKVIEVGQAKGTTVLMIDIFEYLEGGGGGGTSTVIVPDDYSTLSAACAGEKAGASIGVKAGTIIEVADITVKEGQSIFALGGRIDLSADVPAKDPSVVVQMGNYNVFAHGDGCSVEGIYFDFVATDIGARFYALADGAYFKKLTLDFSGSSTIHHGMNAACTESVFEDIKLIGDSLVDPMFSCSQNKNTFNNFVVEGGVVNSGTDIAYTTGDDNVFNNWRMSGVTSVAGQGRYFVFEGGSQRNSLNGIKIACAGATGQKINGIGLGGSHNTINDVVIQGSSVTYRGFTIFGSDNAITNFRIYECEENEVWNGDRHRIEGGVLSTITNIGIHIYGVAHVLVSGIQFHNMTSSNYDIRVSSTGRFVNIINNKMDYDTSIEGDYCIFANNTHRSGSGDVTVAATADQTIIGKNFGFHGNLSDLGTNTQYVAGLHIDTVDPTVNDDQDDGYKWGDGWLNRTDSTYFILADPSATAAVWTPVTTSATAPVKFYSVATGAELQAALQDIHDTATVAKGIITVTADISTSGAGGETFTTEKDVVIRCDPNARYTITKSNGVSLILAEDAMDIEFQNINLYSGNGATSNSHFVYVKGDSGLDDAFVVNVTLRNCTVYNSGSATDHFKHRGGGVMAVNMIDSTFDCNNIGNYLVLAGTANDAHDQLELTRLNIVCSTVDGRVARRSGRTTSLTVNVEQSIVLNSDGLGVWRNDYESSSYGNPEGTFVLYYDEVSQMLFDDVPYTLAPIEDFVNGGGSTTDITDANHGLSEGERITIENSNNYNGSYFVADVIDVNTITIAKPFDADSGSVTGFSDAGGGQVAVISTAHGLTDGVKVEIIGSVNYDGFYYIANSTTNDFEITATYVSEVPSGVTWEERGDWRRENNTPMYAYQNNRKGGHEYFVSDAAEFEAALDDARDRDDINKAIINITDDISLGSGVGATFYKEIELHIRGYNWGDQRYILTAQNSFAINFRRSGSRAIMSDLEFRPIGNNQIFVADTSGDIEYRRVTLDVQFNNVYFNVDAGSAASGEAIGYTYYSHVTATLNLCTWDNSDPHTFTMVGEQNAAWNDSQYDPKGVTVICNDCKIDGQFGRRDDGNASKTFILNRCTVVDTGAVGVWRCDVASGGSATQVNGKLEVFFDSATELNTNLIAGGTSVPIFSPLGNPYKVADITDADHTVLDFDLNTDVDFDSLTANRTCNLPTLADNIGRPLRISKVDNSAFTVTLNPEGAETFLDGTTGKTLVSQGDTIPIIGTANGWKIF